MWLFGRKPGVHKRDNARNGNGTIYVKIAHGDSRGSSPPVTPMSRGVPPSPNGSLSQNGTIFSSFSNNEQNNSQNVSFGLGGIPQTGLTRRFSRLWQNRTPTPTRNGHSPGPVYHRPSGPGPSNILEVLNNRKRTRDLDLSSDSNKMIRPVSTSTPISNADDSVNKHSKRVKFVSIDEMRLHRPLTFDPYQDTQGKDPLTSKSILEQMNQTEKRFFSDTSPVSSTAKKTKTMGSPRGSTSSSTAGRKRRVGNGISLTEFDDEESYGDARVKTGKFCHCNECYAEAAGMTSYMSTSPIKSPIVIKSPNSSAKKTVTFDESSLQRDKSALMCDKGTDMNSQSNKPEVIVRKATHSSGYITKEKYDYDRIKRLERFRRILGLQEQEDAVDSGERNQTTQSNSEGFGSSILQTQETVPPTPVSAPSSSLSSQPSNLSSTPQGGFTFGIQPASNTSSSTPSNQPSVESTSTTPNLNGQFSFGTPKKEPNEPLLAATKIEKSEPSVLFGSDNNDAPSTNLNSASQVGFSFGTQPTSSTASNQPSTTNLGENTAAGGTSPSVSAFNFPSSQASSGGFSFGKQPQANSNAQPPVIQFGNTTEQSQTAQGGITFGTQAVSNSSSTPSTQPSVDSTSTTQNVNSQFSFGTPTATEAKESLLSTKTVKSEPSTLFGVDNNATPSTTVNSTPQVGFSFGSQPTTTGSTASNQLVSTTNSGPISFGSSAAPTNLFGGSTTNPVSNGFGTIAGANSTTSTPSVNFASSQPASSTGGFAFGQQQQPQANSNAPVFQFGNTGQPQTAPGGFNFGAAPNAFGAAASPAAAAKESLLSTKTLKSEPSTLFGASASTTSTNSFGGPVSNTTNAFGPAGNSTSNNVFGTSGNTTSNSVFGAPTNSSSTFGAPATNSGGMSFGSSAQTNPFGGSTTNPVSNGFGTIAGANSTTSTPSVNFASSQPASSTGGFAFGQQQQPQANSNAPVFQFGNTGQPQTAPGGFNFAAAPNAFGAAASPAAAAPGMFSVGQPTSAPSTLFGVDNNATPSTTLGFLSVLNQPQLAVLHQTNSLQQQIQEECRLEALLKLIYLEVIQLIQFLMDLELLLREEILLLQHLQFHSTFRHHNQQHHQEDLLLVNNNNPKQFPTLQFFSLVTLDSLKQLQVDLILQQLQMHLEQQPALLLQPQECSALVNLHLHHDVVLLGDIDNEKNYNLLSPQIKMNQLISFLLEFLLNSRTNL